MDRFRFRVYDVKTKEYEYFFELKEYIHKLVSIFEGIYSNEENDYFLTNIIEQCTGMKDYNDNLIFEGDLVYVHGEDEGIVKYDQDECKFVVEIDNVLYDFSHFGPRDIEVIGNIHQEEQ